MKKFLSILCSTFLCMLAAGCSEKKDSSLKFVTSCYPVYIMALNITENINGIEIIQMSGENTGCMHNYQIQSKDLQNIEKSSAFIINGAGFEPFIEKITREMPKVNIIDSSNGIELLCNEEKHCSHDDHDHDEHCHDECCHEHHKNCHHECNPHIWLSVNNYIKQVQNISERLIKIDPQNTENYKTNTENYIRKLEIFKKELHKQLETIQNKDIIMFHDAFTYFAKEFNLNIIPVTNNEPEQELSAKEMAEIIEIIKNKNVKYICCESEKISESIRAIAKETNTQIITLNSGTSGDFTKNSYIQTMSENAQILKKHF